MAWTVYGEEYMTADASNLRVYQPVKFNATTVLRACRAWFVVYNNPSFTSIQMKVYSNSSSNTPKKLICTSTNSITKAQMITLNNGVKEIYFEFNYPTFQANETYNFVPVISGYTGTSSSHIAWKHTYPDPPYRTNLTVDYNFLLKSPYDLTFVGAEL